MKNWPFLAIVSIAIIFFWQLFSKGLLPIPADTIVGLYHPFRDVFAKDYPRGLPFKNFLITDPVRQQYPWRNLAIDLGKRSEFPLWNPYSFSGTPLLANFQSGVFYPANLLFFIFPFHIAWSYLIFLEPILAGLFTYLFLRNLKLGGLPSLFGAFAFSFSGFFMAWLEWGTIIHTALWLPLILLSIDKVVEGRKLLSWISIFIFSLTAAFFAGHLQTFFYIFLVSIAYLILRIRIRKATKLIPKFIVSFIIFIAVSSLQWIPTLRLILLSGRGLDQDWRNIEGWFIPWQNLTQFFAPDFFGNPATLNYWGVFNYGEFIGYVGIPALIMALFSLFFRRDKKTLFFGTLFFLSLIFSLPTIFAKLPYIFNIPFISTAQPTRLLFITDFSLSVLAALGFDLFLRSRKNIIYPVVFVAIILISLWGYIFFGNSLFPEISKENLMISQRNLILPTLIFILSAALILISFYGRKQIRLIIYSSLLIILVFDLLRFGLKFNPFTDKQYLFPESKSVDFIKKDKDLFRIMTDDSRILAPNFSLIYKLQSVDGYDPLFVERYAELIAASERGEPNINPPFGFNRIITPHNFNSKIIDLLGVKYVLSLKDLESPKLEKVFQEGETRIFINQNAFPRAFFVEKVVRVKDKKEAIDKIFSEDLKVVAVVEDSLDDEFVVGEARVISYSESRIIIETENSGNGFLVVVENFYPTWRAKIDGKETKIYRTDFNFRGITVPEGEHVVEFSNSLL